MGAEEPALATSCYSSPAHVLASSSSSGSPFLCTWFLLLLMCRSPPLCFPCYSSFFFLSFIPGTSFSAGLLFRLRVFFLFLLLLWFFFLVLARYGAWVCLGYFGLVLSPGYFWAVFFSWSAFGSFFSSLVWVLS